MAVYQHVLAAVDFTPESEQVIERAAALRDASEIKLSLAHVVEYLPMAYAGDLALPNDYDLEQELVEAARRRMDQLASRLGVAEEQCHVLLGTTSREILHIAEQQAVDLIVVGSHGRHGLALLLGSTANAVLHHAHCDVLAVRIKHP